ncbi:MAG TPA: biotin/lipoyl-containing protein [Polyangiaceae bacterium]|nr:biotin/lipoyl-containing protein [Polyangiaceae bacterium]
MTAPPEKRFRLWLDEREQELFVQRTHEGGSFEVKLEREGAARTLRVLRGLPSPIVLVDGRVLRLGVFEQGDERRVNRGPDAHRLRVGPNNPALNARRAQVAPGLLVAPMPGRVVAVRVSVGDSIEKGALLLVIEAMKMQNELFAARAGRVQEVLVAPGETVERGAALIRVA